jgi:hypothetical protein
MESRREVTLVATLIIFSLAACGGEGGVSSTPAPPLNVTPPAPPPAPPPPPPPPPAPPPAPTGNIGLISDEPFAVQAIGYSVNSGAVGEDLATDVNADVDFRYIATNKTYEIKLPGYEAGVLRTNSYSGSYINSDRWQSISGTNNEVLLGTSTTPQPVHLYLSWPSADLNPGIALTYTSWGRWTENPNSGQPQKFGLFAYGITTAANDVPRTGEASYSATVQGTTEEARLDFQTYVTGTAKLLFNFGAGTLSGSMTTTLCPWDCDTPIGEYKFKDTVYSTGSQTFSGAFDVPGSTAPSFFGGNFNGPAAAELMARWRAPFKYPDSPTAPGSWGMMSGIWVGKKD